jgi:hypothetical protein
MMVRFARLVAVFAIVTSIHAATIDACCDPAYDIGCVCDASGCEILASPLVVNLSSGPWRLTGRTAPL